VSYKLFAWLGFLSTGNYQESSPRILQLDPGEGSKPSTTLDFAFKNIG